MFSTRCHQLARSLFCFQALTPAPRGISTSKLLQDSYYDALGISANSTQNDIKAAYYKLSMIYHPDKNQGSESAAIKFRQITQAYEVLGNYRLRRLYDKGIIHTAGSQYAQPADLRHDTVDVEEDDPQTKFYKSRFSKSKVTNEQGGAPPIYDFDEWARAHYGKSFDRRKAAKERYDRQEARKVEKEFTAKNEIIIFGVVVSFIVFYLIVYMEQSYDTPKHKRGNKTE